MLIHQSSSIYVVGCASSTQVGKWLQGPDELTGTKTETLPSQLELPRARTERGCFPIGPHWSAESQTWVWTEDSQPTTYESTVRQRACAVGSEMCMSWWRYTLTSYVCVQAACHLQNGWEPGYDWPGDERTTIADCGVWGSALVSSDDILTHSSGSQFGFKWSIDHSLQTAYSGPFRFQTFSELRNEFSSLISYFENFQI